MENSIPDAFAFREAPEPLNDETSWDGLRRTWLPMVDCSMRCETRRECAGENPLRLPTIAATLPFSRGNALDIGAQRRQLAYVVLVSAIDMLKAIHLGLSIGNDAGEDQCRARTQIGG